MGALFASLVVIFLPVMVMGFPGDTPRVGFTVQVLFMAFMAGTFPALSLHRDKRAGTLELFALAGRRPWEILGGKLLAAWVAGVVLLAQALVIAALVNGLFSISWGFTLGSLLAGIAALLLVSSLVMWFEVATGLPRSARAFGEGVLLALGVGGGAWLASSVDVPLAAVLLAAGLLSITGLFALSCLNLSRYAPAHEPDIDVESPRRRLSGRKLSGRDVAHPVFEASRIRTTTPWTPLVAILACVVVYPVALEASLRIQTPWPYQDHSWPEQLVSLLHLLASLYAPGMALLMGREALTVDLSSSTFALLAATPLPTRRILWERVTGRLCLSVLAPLPLGALLAAPPMPVRNLLAGLLILASFSVLVYTTTVAARSHGGPSTAVLSDLAMLLVLLALGFDTVIRVSGIFSGNGAIEVASVLPLCYLLAALAAWRLAVRRFEAARRCIA